MGSVSVKWSLTLSGVWFITAVGTVRSQEAIQLDVACSAAVGNQAAVVRPDGTFLVQNISIFQSRDTGVDPQLYRVRTTSLCDGETVAGEPKFFELDPGQTTFFAAVFPSGPDPHAHQRKWPAQNGRPCRLCLKSISSKFHDASEWTV